MSNKTFNMSTNQAECTIPLPSRDLQLGLSSEGHYSDLSLSPSPDYNSNISNLSDREASSSPDVNMLECCLSDGSPVDKPYSTTLPQGNVLCGVSMNLNQTFIATPVNGNVNFWNEDSSLMRNHETGSEKYQTFSTNTEDGSSSAVTSPDSAGRESQMDSCDTSRRGSTENDFCSLSSGEMVIRSNSFCREDQSLIVVSSLEESSVSLAGGHQALPAEPNLLSTILLDVSEKSPERVIEENTGHLCLGMTFTQAELPIEENDTATSNSRVALLSENEGGLLMTFVCETSPADCGKEAQVASAEGHLLSVPGAFTPEQTKTFVSTLSAMQDTDKDVHTSTPVQNTGKMTPSLPSFSVSPCTENAGKPGHHAVKQQHISVAPKRLVAGLPPSTGKAKKIEIKKFPKSDFSSIKSKVVTRNVHSVSVPGPASQHKPSQVNVHNKHTEAHRGATIRNSPAKVRNSIIAVTTPTKMVNNAQRQVNTSDANFGVAMTQSSRQPAVDGQGKSRASSPYHQLAAKKCASVVQCSNASSETEQAASSQVANSAAQHAGNQLFCVSSLEKSPDRSGQTDPKPSPKKGKIQVRSGSALGQDKPPVLKMRPRCSSESSSSSRPLKEKKATPRLSASFTVSKAVTHLGQTKPGNLNCSSHNKQAEATNGPAENSTREAKKISLVAESRKSSTAGTSWDESKSGFRVRPSPRRARGAPLSQAPAASPRPATLSTRQRQGTLGKDECRISNTGATPQSKQRSSTTLATACKPAASTSKGPANSTVSPLKRSASARLVRGTSSGPVDKNKPKAGSRHQPPQQQASQRSQSNGPPDVVPASVVGGGRQDQSIQQLRGLLAANNCRFEAVAIVLQQTLAERDEATRQCRDLSQELVNLRGELVCSVHSSERLEKEKDELRVALEDALQKLQEQHQKDLAELEHRLQTFYQAEWDKVHLTYQEEADKCKTLMQQQMEELKADHEAMKLELENSHTEQLQCVKQQYEMSLEELSKVHNQELQSLDKTLRDAEAALSGQIEALTAENKALIEKLTAEENRRKELAEMSQKDSHTLYLEQELESLKVVLEIKNEQLHQQEKKLMEIDKLKEKNVQLDESLKRVQQLNEDLTARMDKHAALSRQLSTEQAVLQESLQKESKVNKRLSMENEELLWKLHNGDLSSPRKVSPTSTPSSQSFSLQSPRSSGLFSSPPVSPR
ncbi:microtubule-associated tumor suppressor 1 homolog A isoform X2 [Chaetodon trifascialis]|uniref:microtubule-associated tumor suppressor 1 homolog A isoform X2 n=1 Tax=Chaetodon trifascialis TaxID=109706 RepID=UPI00399578F0